MSKAATLAIVGRGYWGQIYKKTIDKMDAIILPEENIYGKNYKEAKNENLYSADGVIIAASTWAHYEIASYLLQHGVKNLLIEKPLTQTYAQAIKLQKLTETIPDAKVMVGHTLLYDPAYKKMKKFAQEKLGKISRIEYFSLKTPPIKRGTVIQDAGSPPIYLFIDLIAKTPIRVSAQPKKDDNVKLTLEFGNGALAIANIGSIYPKRRREIVIMGEGGKLMLNEFMNPRKLTFTENSGKKKKLFFPTNRTALEEEIQEFVSSIIRNIKPKTSYDCGVEVVKVIEAAQESFEKNGERKFA